MKQHSRQFLTLVTEAKMHIKEIPPQTLYEKLTKPDLFCLIDVREDSEWTTGHISKAIHLSKGVIERDIEKKLPDFHTQIVVYCSGGFRSALVANSLQKMGYTQVSSLATGLQGWLDAGYSIEST